MPVVTAPARTAEIALPQGTTTWQDWFSLSGIKKPKFQKRPQIWSLWRLLIDLRANDWVNLLMLMAEIRRSPLEAGCLGPHYL